MKIPVAILTLVVGFAAVAGDAQWTITKIDKQYYISDGDWTFKATLGSSRVLNQDGSSRVVGANGLYGLVVNECTAYPESITPLDFSKPLVNETENGREYAINEFHTKLGTAPNSGGEGRVCTATPAGMVAGRLTMPVCDYQFKLNSAAFCKCEHIDFDLAGLPEGLVRIEKDAFAEADIHGDLDCENLNYVGDYSFTKTPRMGGFRAPQLTYAGNYSFCYSAVTNINLGTGSGFTQVSMYSFCYCTNLVSFTPFLPEACTRVLRGGFCNCYKLASPLVFYGRNNQEKPGASSGWDIFHDCRSLPSVDLSHSTVKYLGHSMFENCYSLQWVKLPEDIGCIGFSNNGNEATVFRNCTNLVSVIPFMPESVTNIGLSVFENCSKLRGNLKLPCVTDVTQYGFRNSGIDSVEFGPNLVSIGNSAFAGSTNLVGVSSPKGLSGVTLGNQVFNGCTGMSGELDLRFVKAMGNQMFRYAKISTLRLGELDALSQMVFLDMAALREIYWYGDKPATINSSIFQGCGNSVVTNFVPRAYSNNWAAVVTEGGPLGKDTAKWTSNSKTWIRLWNPYPGLRISIR